MAILNEIEEASSSSSPPIYDRNNYDVFLSFRGVDTRLGFTNHLHSALMEASLVTFYDDHEIQNGESLKPELENAIKASSASVVVLSENYASSTWCLDELVLILEQKRDSNQIVIPIFFHVEPMDVRKQQGSFGEAMEKHRLKMEAKTDVEEKSVLAAKMEIWKKALTEVSNLKGMDARGRPERDLTDDILKDLHSRLDVASWTSTLPLLIGMDHEIEMITSWLTDGSSHTTDILTITGVGGIGKTSLAKYVYKLHCSQFTRSSFVNDVNMRHDGKFQGLLDIQNQLIGDISKRNMTQVHDVAKYTFMIEKTLALKKMLIVLDDINSLEQLNGLLGSSDSLELLCFHAFKCSHKPKEGYEDVSKKLVKYCGGHPLALEVLGGYLQTEAVKFWEERVELLKKEPYFDVQKHLMMSYDSLPSENDKELFKYIACFFVGTDRDLTQTILDACDIKTISGIKILKDRCLVRITENNELMMHSLIQVMGRDLIRQESPNKPWERSHIWSDSESFQVLKESEGTRNVLGLALDMRMLEEDILKLRKVDIRMFEKDKLKLNTDALSKMNNLKLLQLNYVKINGSYKNISRELRWLCMHGFHFKSIPLDLPPMENLVVLDMSYSKIESFDMSYSSSERVKKKLKGMFGSSSKYNQVLGSLKILDLSFCQLLHSVDGFYHLPALEQMILSNCSSLISVGESIEQCVELLLIDLSNCKNLGKLPRSIGKLKRMKTLLANGCDHLLVFPPELRDMDSLQTLEMDYVYRNSEISSFPRVEVNPRDLNSFMTFLPVSLVHLSLRHNNLSSESFPESFSGLHMLETLDLLANPIVSMPYCLRDLPRLVKLNMASCELLETVEHPPSSLKELVLGGMATIRKMKFNPEMSPLSLRMTILKRHYTLIEGVIEVQPLEHVEDKMLRSLGWDHLIHTNKQQKVVGLQMCYEFGIFSTCYGGKEMPNWISYRSKQGSEISFIIPPSPNKLRGLNFCCVLDEKFLNLNRHFDLPMIIIRNITKNGTWIYDPYASKVKVAEDCCSLTYVSHWMFGINEMEEGDQITISTAKVFEYNVGSIRECGIGFVYDERDDDEMIKEEKEDVLGYYKSWNHIIGGDLSPFQTTTGEYILFTTFFSFKVERLSRYSPFIKDGNQYHLTENRPAFRAFSLSREV